MEKTKANSTFKSELIKYIVSLNQTDGVGFELCLKEPYKITSNGETLEIVRLLVNWEDGRLLCHAFDNADETRFIIFDSLPLGTQKEIYEFVI